MPQPVIYATKEGTEICAYDVIEIRNGDPAKNDGWQSYSTLRDRREAATAINICRIGEYSASRNARIPGDDFRIKSYYDGRILFYLGK